MNNLLPSPDFSQIPPQPMNAEVLNPFPTPEVNNAHFIAKVGNIAINGYQVSPLKNEINYVKAPLSAPGEDKFATPLPEDLPLNTIDAEAIRANLAQMQAYKAEAAAQAERVYRSVKLPIHESSLALGSLTRRARRAARQRPGQRSSYRLAA